MDQGKQLALSFLMYTDDSKQWLVASLGCSGSLHGQANLYNGPPVWMLGDTNTSPWSWDPNTLTNCPLWVYLGKSTTIFKCPSDPTTVTIAGVIHPRLRSISMSQVFDDGTWLTPGNWQTFAKLAAIAHPAETFVFIDENPSSINDRAFATQCDGYAGFPGSPGIVDIPAAYHHDGAGLSFADGHAALHKWVGSHIVNYNKNTDPGGVMYTSGAGDLADFNYLAANSTMHR